MSLTTVVEHFQQKDPIIHKAIAKMDIPEWVKPISPDLYFDRLCRNIVGQQLSTKAARVIVGRFRDLLGEVTPSKVLATDDQLMRDAGMSWAKIRYVNDLSQKSLDGLIPYEKLSQMSNEEVIESLTLVKGIGVWTAEMFLIGPLGREDVFSYLDLGLRKGIKNLYKLDDLPTKEEAKKITDPWSPYRTYGSIALWHSLDNM